MADNIRKEIESELQILKDNIHKFKGAVEIIDEAQKISEETRKQLIAASDKNKATLEKSSKKLENLLSKQESQIIKFDEISDELTELQKGLNDAELVERVKNLEDLIQSVKKISTEKFDDIIAEIKKSQQALNNQIELLLRSSKSISDTTSKIEADLGSSFNSLSNFLKKSFSKILTDLTSHNTENHNELLNKLKTQQIITYSGFGILLLTIIYLIFSS